MNDSVFLTATDSGDHRPAGTHLDDKVVMRLLPAGLTLAVPVSAFHSVGEHISERAFYFGGGSWCARGGSRRGGGLATRRTHFCEEERKKGKKKRTNVKKEAQNRIEYATVFQFFSSMPQTNHNLFVRNPRSTVAAA